MLCVTELINDFLVYITAVELADCFNSSVTAPQDAHELVLEVAEWLTASLSGLARYELTT